MNKNFIQDLTQWIEEHLDIPLDLDTVAKRSGYSKWHLQRVFKKSSGTSLAQYIRKRRLKKATLMLLTTAMPVTEIALLLGFDSIHSFYRSFKNHYGLAPGVWRKRCHAVARATIEVGRINKTLYLLNYIDDEDYRRRILTQLNRGESRHAVARAVCHGQKG